MTDEQVGATIRAFLRDHPEHIAGVKKHPQHGYLMDNDAVTAFARWSKTNGGDPEKCVEFIRFLKER